MEKDHPNKVRKYYNEHVDDEDHRLENHPFEMPVTMYYVEKYLVPGQAVFDVACGTGHIAGQLLDKGFKLGLNDLSDRNVELVKQRLGGHPGVLFVNQADALQRSAWNHPLWDGILILGPLYHMISRANRLKVLQMACSNVKPGGYVLSSFMTRMGALIYGVKNNPRGILYPDGAEKLWETGTDDRFVEATEYFTNAWFCHPEQVQPLVEEAGLQPLHLAGAEGLFGERFELFHHLEEGLKKQWMEFVINHCEDPHMVNQSKHLLSVARKPL